MTDTAIHRLLAAKGKVDKAVNPVIDQTYKDIQKPGLLNGMTRTYTPLDENGETLPSEEQLVQLRVPIALQVLQESFERIWDLTATIDFGNLEAKADVIIDGNVIAEGVPTTHLLWLEKQIHDLVTFLKKLPTLDPARRWEWSDQENAFATTPTKSNRTKKVLKVLEKSPGTDKHPAQTETYSDDVVIGTYEAINYSGAVSKVDQTRYLNRAEELLEAVSDARARANAVEVPQVKIAGSLLDYVFSASE